MHNIVGYHDGRFISLSNKRRRRVEMKVARIINTGLGVAVFFALYMLAGIIESGL